MKALKVTLVGAAAIVAAALAFAYSGIIDVGADAPHWGSTYWLVETVREHSIAIRAQSVGAAPDLDDPTLLALGAEHYAEMCTGCHLAPGMEDTEMRAGLYPKPPNLAERADDRTPGETFWIIKHGLKMTAMPAWGVTHDDRIIWGMVAFVQKLPELTASQYEEMVGQERASGHSHGGEEPPGAHESARTPHEEDEEAAGHSHGSEGEKTH
jgi:mono/diheme cytochrome c family protein